MRRVFKTAALLALSVAVPATVHAYGPRVRKNCANDYMDNCHLHKLGSPELRACMRKAGPKLTPQCVDALVAEGEVSAKEVADRRAAATPGK